VNRNQSSCINLLEVVGYTLLRFLRRLARPRRDHEPYTLQLHEPRLCQRVPERGPIEPIKIVRSEDIGDPEVDFFDMRGGYLGYHEGDPREGAYPSEEEVECLEVRAVGYRREKICAVCIQEKEAR